MGKILGGLAAAILVAVAGYFGFQLYVQQRAASDVDAAFAAMRASGATATHGKVAFDLWTRTLTVADIAGDSAGPSPTTVKIGSFTASGVGQSEPNRFTAKQIVVTDAAFTGAIGGPARKFTYAVPRIEIADYAGPTALPAPAGAAAAGDLYKLMLEQFALVSATSLTAPTVKASMTMPAANATAPSDVAYAGFAARDIRGGKIAAITIDRMTFTATIENAGKADKMTGEIADMAAYDYDSASTLAMFDPARAKDDKYTPAYRQMKTGAYTATFATGMKFRIDSMAANDLAVKPSRLQFPLLMALIDSMPAPGTTPTQPQMRDLMEKMAGLYDGLYLGNAEIRGMAIEGPGGPFKLGAIKLGKLENGKLAELAFEGLDGRAPQGPFQIGRFALRSLDVANLMRTAGQFSGSKQDPSPEQLVSLLLLLDGAELRDLVTPYKNSPKPVRVDTFTLGWGQFVGPIPTKLRAALRMGGPVDLADPEPFRTMAASGMDAANLNADLGMVWDEATKAFTLEPITAEVGGIANAALRVNLAGVAREVFSLNPLQAAVMAAQIEAGPIELAVRDIGGVELFLTQFAKTQNVSREDAQAGVLAALQANAEQIAAVNPDAMTIANAIKGFIENPRGTLTVKLKPRGKVAMMGLLDALKKNPALALAQFDVEAGVGR